MKPKVTHEYQRQFELKYGCNPHQQPAAIYAIDEHHLPFHVLNGRPGYINLLDAVNSWQLVKELDEATGLAAAASFKHVSPAGAALGKPLNPVLKKVYECQGVELSPLATAYMRARGADPMSSFGDFIALSRKVDVSTARLIKPLVSDGVIAPAYEEEALEILKAKKKGSYNILEANPYYVCPEIEYREAFGVSFAQKRNVIEISEQSLLHHIVTENQEIPESAKQDLLLASITLKYTQSNSVGYALDGQMIGIGAGQQSRVDCTKLAGRKAEIWFLRQHPKVMDELEFKEETKRVDRINARIRYIEDDMTPNEYHAFAQAFVRPAYALDAKEKRQWLDELKHVSLASDAFFPFRDNIDQASKRGVRYIAQSGGSVRDQEIIDAANEYGMMMAFTGIRLFHH